MFGFLQSIFATSSGLPGNCNDALIQAAIERVVDGTDPRLRAIGNYQRKLCGAVTQAIDYVTALIDRLPPAIDASRRSFMTMPQLRAAFISPSHLQEVLTFGKPMRDYLHEMPGPLPAELYAVLSMDRVEKTMLGVALQGDTLLREVPQINVSFQNHRITFPSKSELETRQELRCRAFDSLIESVLNQLTAVRARRQQLEQQQRQLLQQKALALRSARMGLDCLLESTTPCVADASLIERRLLDIQDELRRIHTDSATIERVLAQIVATLSAPEQHLRLEPVSLALNHMNIKVQPDSAQTASSLTFNEVQIGADRPLTVLLVRFPSSELLPQPDFFQEAQRLLTPRLLT